MRKKNTIKKSSKKRNNKNTIRFKSDEYLPHVMTRLYVQPNVMKNDINDDIKKALGNIFYSSDVKSKNLTCVNRKNMKIVMVLFLGVMGVEYLIILNNN